ncbi:MAG TPA: hypothetical protein VMW04_00400 [Patescibacteria group bacterium]|nr:hypothetical protein [Patescibacteria group bacterium]
MVKDYLPRVIKASHFLRSHGLPTERVIEARKLERVPFEGKQITVEEWKEPALASFLQKTDSEELRKEKPNFLEKLKESLTNMEFVVVERDYPIGERLKDLRQIQTWKETPLTQKNAETFFRKVLRLHNLNADKESCEILAKKLDATKEEDWDYYLSIVLPVKMGRYLGRMHSLGLYHNFPTTHNWTVSGDLVDLDSVKGLPIFPTDSPIGEPEIKLDIDRTFSTLKDLGYLGHICTAKHFSYFIASYMNTYRKGQSWPQRWFPGPIEKLIYEKNLRFYAVALTEAKKLAQTLDV